MSVTTPPVGENLLTVFLLVTNNMSVINANILRFFALYLACSIDSI